MESLKNTIVFMVVGVTMIMLFSLLVSLIIVAAGSKYRALRMSFILPILLPSGGVALIWRALFNIDGGLLSAPPYELNFISFFLSPQILPVYLIFVWKYCGFNIILITSAILNVDREISEAAALDGANGLTTYRKIILPIIQPALFFAAILSVVNSFRVFKEIFYLFDTNYPTGSAYILQYYMNNAFNKLDYQALSSGSIVLTLFLTILVLFAYSSKDGSSSFERRRAK